MDDLIAAADALMPNGGVGLGGNIRQAMSPISKSSGKDRVQFELEENEVPDEIRRKLNIKLRPFIFLDEKTIDLICEGDLIMAGVVRGVQAALKAEVEEVQIERKDNGKKQKAHDEIRGEGVYEGGEREVARKDVVVEGPYDDPYEKNVSPKEVAGMEKMYVVFGEAGSGGTDLGVRMLTLQNRGQINPKGYFKMQSHFGNMCFLSRDSKELSGRAATIAGVCQIMSYERWGKYFAYDWVPSPKPFVEWLVTQWALPREQRTIQSNNIDRLRFVENLKGWRSSRVVQTVGWICGAKWGVNGITMGLFESKDGESGMNDTKGATNGHGGLVACIEGMQHSISIVLGGAYVDCAAGMIEFLKYADALDVFSRRFICSLAVEPVANTMLAAYRGSALSLPDGETVRLERPQLVAEAIKKYVVCQIALMGNHADMTAKEAQYISVLRRQDMRLSLLSASSVDESFGEGKMDKPLKVKEARKATNGKEEKGKWDGDGRHGICVGHLGFMLGAKDASRKPVECLMQVGKACHFTHIVTLKEITKEEARNSVAKLRNDLIKVAVLEKIERFTGFKK